MAINPYGLHGVPAVGGGLPGLPRREHTNRRISDALPVGTVKAGIPPDYGVWEELEGQIINSPEYLAAVGASGPNEVLTRLAYVLDGGNALRNISWSYDSKYLLGFESAPVF